MAKIVPAEYLLWVHLQSLLCSETIHDQDRLQLRTIAASMAVLCDTLKRLRQHRMSRLQTSFN